MKKPGTTESFPFGNDTLVFKVLGKIYALANIETFEGVNLKCDPEKAELLRSKYPAVKPGVHMNKKHWNTIVMNDSVPDKCFLEWVDDSYALVVQKLPLKDQEQLKSM